MPFSRRKILNKQPNFIPKGDRKRTTKPKSSIRKEIIKIRAEINDIETKKSKKQNKTKQKQNKNKKHNRTDP